MGEDEQGTAPSISRAELYGRVRHAMATERFMRRLGWIVLALAVVSLSVTVAMWLLGEISVEQALATIFGVIISSILSGAAAYSSGVNVGLGAMRLLLAVRDDEDAGG